MILRLDDVEPRVDPSTYVQSSARVIGDVHIGMECSVWFNAVVRGDVHFIRIGARTNIQDNATVHVTTNRWATHVGDDVTVGHAAVLHGCTIGNRVLVGIGSIVMDGVEIGDDCLIGAGSLLTPGTRIASGLLVIGSPGKAVRELRDDERAHIRRSAENYCRLAERYRRSAID